MSSADKIQPDEFDKELEQLMSQNGKKTGKRNGRKKKVAAAVVIFLAAGFFMTRFLGSRETRIPSVMTVTPVKKTIQNRLSVSGPVSGTDSVDVVSNLHSEILEISVKEGDRVSKGQVLAVLDDEDLKKEVTIAKNDYDLAVSTYAEREKEAGSGYARAVQELKSAQAAFDRNKVLYDSGDIPLVELEASENALNDAKRQKSAFTLKDGKAAADESYRLQVEKARFDYEKMQEKLSDTEIKSPIDGTVVRVNTKVGRFADKTEDAEPLFVIENLDVLEMEIKVSEYSIGKVKIGQHADISAAILNGDTVSGQVVSISPTGEEKGGGSTERVIPTRIRITDRDTKLIAGITAKAQIILEEEKDALTVPVSAVWERDGDTTLMTVRDGTVHLIPVKIGVESDVEVQVIPENGELLDEMTAVIASPGEMYTEGMEVVPVNK